MGVPWRHVERSLRASASECILAFIIPSWRDDSPDVDLNQSACVDVLRSLRMEAFGVAMRAGTSIELFCASESGCGFLVLAGLACSIPISVTDNYPTLLRLSQLGQNEFLHRFSLSSLSRVIEHGLEQALEAPRAAATVEVASPSPGDSLPCQLSTTQPDSIWRCALRVAIYRTDFVPPDDGVWCIRVNEIEIICQGDTQDHATAEFDFVSRPENTPTVEVSVVIRAPSLGDVHTLRVARVSKPALITMFIPNF